MPYSAFAFPLLLLSLNKKINITSLINLNIVYRLKRLKNSRCTKIVHLLFRNGMILLLSYDEVEKYVILSLLKWNKKYYNIMRQFVIELYKRWIYKYNIFNSLMQKISLGCYLCIVIKVLWLNAFYQPAITPGLMSYTPLLSTYNYTTKQGRTRTFNFPLRRTLIHNSFLVVIISLVAFNYSSINQLVKVEWIKKPFI